MDPFIKLLIVSAFFACFFIHSVPGAYQRKGGQKKESSLTGWTEWGNWSACSVTCGSGLRTKSRVWIFKPDDPRAKGDPFTNTASVECAVEDTPCPVDGKWSPWGVWRRCSVACGGGKRKRTRECNEPRHGGADCEGDNFEEEECKTKPCPRTPPFFDMSQCSPETNFTCKNQLMCVPLRQQCDYIVHCSDGTDEMGCTRSHYKIGRVHFSNTAARLSASSGMAVLTALISIWLVTLFIGGHGHTTDQSSLSP